VNQLSAVEVDFIDGAPIRILRSGVVHAPVDAVFNAIACHPNGYARWFPGFSTASTWTSNPPHGVGSQRHMQALGSSFEETVLAWKADEEFAFRADAFPFPGHAAFAERWRMRAVDDDSTELSWVVAIEPTRLAPVVHGIWLLVTRMMMRLAARGLSKHLDAKPPAS
jgi:hypothetical protein